MRFSRRFLRMKEENQHFPQMTIIRHKIRHFHITKSIWRKNKITNVSKRFIYHMPKLGSCRFGYVKIDQHLLLEPSIHKQRELSCAPNKFLFHSVQFVLMNWIRDIWKNLWQNILVHLELFWDKSSQLLWPQTSQMKLLLNKFVQGIKHKSEEPIPLQSDIFWKFCKICDTLSIS